MIRPIMNNVLIKPDQKEEVTAGGIFLPEVSQYDRCEGTVAAVGPGYVNSKGKRVPPDVRVGDRVYLHRHSGQAFEYDGVKYIAVDADGILSIIE